MSGTDSSRLIYWDACVYLAWLRNEQSHGQEAMDGIREAANDVFQRKTIIVTSTITLTEVLSFKLSLDQERLVRKSFRSQDHVLRDVDPPVALKARDFREALRNHRPGKNLATPDAIHLATASIYKAGEFWTFDGGKSDKGSLGLLGLTGDPRLGGLKICKPWRAQPGLFAPGLIPG